MSEYACICLNKQDSQYASDPKYVKILNMVKACARYLLSNFYFSPNDSPSKTMKNVFYFISKALFVLEILKFFYFRLPSFFPCQLFALEVDLRKS